MSEQISEAFDKIVTLGLALGVSNLKDREGAWVHKIDEHWTVALNGKDDELRVQPEGTMGATLQPFNAAIWFNGWLAGTMSPFEGFMAAGELANEDTFIDALDRAIAEAV